MLDRQLDNLSITTVSLGSTEDIIVCHQHKDGNSFRISELCYPKEGIYNENKTGPRIRTLRNTI